MGKLWILPLCAFLGPRTLLSQALHYLPSFSLPAFFKARDLPEHPLGACQNPARLAGCRRPAVAVFGSRLFNLSAFREFSGAAVIPTGHGVIACSTAYFGGGGYGESDWGLSFGKDLGEIDLAIGFHYFRIQMEGYGSAGTVAFSGGLRWRTSPSLQFQTWLFNPAGGWLGGTREERLASVYGAGLLYRSSPVLQLDIRCQKEEGRSTDLQLSIHYQPLSKFFCSAGIHTNTTAAWAGVGWTWKSITAGFYCQFHRAAGISPGMEFIFCHQQKPA